METLRRDKMTELANKDIKTYHKHILYVQESRGKWTL